LPLDVYKDWLGIPDGPRPPDHYQLLRLVQFEDAIDKIRANYKKLNAHVRRYATGQYLEESQALLNEMAKAMLCLTDQERKREYDVGLGREVEERETGPRTMDVILLEQKHISPAQAKEAREHAERTGLDLRDSLVQLKMVDADLAAQALAQELGLSYVDLTDLYPDEDVLDQVPKKTVKQNSILPLFIDEGVLLVAGVHQIEPELDEELRMRFGVPVRSVLAAPMQINQAISKYYAPGMRNEVTAPAAKAAPETKPAKKTGAPAKPTAEREPETKRRQTVLSPEERKQQRSIGIIIINFSVFVAYLLNAFVVTPRVHLDIWTAVLFIGVPGLTALFVWPKYFKK
jgi:Type II secretion system (T2SS), protein E, N-terminal domain